MRDVVLLDPSGPEALRLPRVSAALSPRSLLVLAPRLSQLYIEDAHLVVRRDAQGRLHIAGIDVPVASPKATGVEDTGALDWFFSQQEFVLRHGSLRWIDEQRGGAGAGAARRRPRRPQRPAQPRDAPRRTPPPGWGDRFSLRVARRPAAVRERRRLAALDGGTVYADLRAATSRNSCLRRPPVPARRRPGRAAPLARLPDEWLARRDRGRAAAAGRPAPRARRRTARHWPMRPDG
jgi:hypothetical protein